MDLSNLKPAKGSTRSRKRIARGQGSGYGGHSSTKGNKGQKARSGTMNIGGFEGGQMPLHMRLPKRGFNNPFGKDYAEVNLGQVQKLIEVGKLDAKAVVDHAALQAAGIARGGKDGVRLLGKGEFSTKVSFKVAGASKGAVAAVEKAGGAVDIIVAKDKAELAAAKKGTAKARAAK